MLYIHPGPFTKDIILRSGIRLEIIEQESENGLVKIDKDCNIFGFANPTPADLEMILSQLVAVRIAGSMPNWN